MHQPTITSNSILRDPLFTVALDGATRTFSLPGLIGQLIAGPENILAFPHVTPVQRSYWYRFLVRCGARALRSLDLDVHSASRVPAEELAEAIEQVLREAAGGDAAWKLQQPDPKLPGFLQPPTPDGQPPHSSYKANSMSLLTSAMGSKMHERKLDVDRVLTPEQAVYALVEYQMGVIFGGSGNYASQLMGSASGAGSGTPFMGVRIGSGYGETFRHDVGVFLNRWDRIRSALAVRGTIWALWAEPWDGVSQLPAEMLDPAFIPIARLVRLDEPDVEGRFRTVWFRTTKCARILDHSDGGVLGDIFTPLVPHPKHPGGWKVRGTMKSGYDYQEVVRLLFSIDASPSDSVAALAASGSASRSDVRVVFEGTAYEQGKTGGFHYREVLLPTTSTFSFLAQPEPVQAAHTAMLAMARAAKNAIRGATRVLLAGSPRRRDGDEVKVEGPARALDRVIDRTYIPTLLAAAERHAHGDLSYLTDWGLVLTALTRTAFEEAMKSVPTSGARRYEREVFALTWLDVQLRKMRGEEADTAGREDDFDTLTEEESE